MIKEKELPGMKKVEIRVRIPEYKRDKLNIISAIRKVAVNDMLSEYIDHLISTSQELNALEQPKKERFSIQGIFEGGGPIPKEAIDEAIKEWNKVKELQ